MADNIQQLDLFNFGRERKVITKPIRIIELFSGIGAQFKALKTLEKATGGKITVESWRTCEWSIPSIKAYNYIHIKDFTDYGKDKTREEMFNYLNGNISSNSSDPISENSLKRYSTEKLKDIYNNCIATHNLMNIMKVKGVDLGITDTDKYEYIMTYSFPCQ